MFDREIFDAKIIIIKCGMLLNPDEKNISVLYEETSKKLGLPPLITHTGMADHLPAPHEIAQRKEDDFVLPRKKCPQCKTENSFVLAGLCNSCKDSEDGKYKTAWICISKECRYKEKSEKYFTQWLKELGIEIPTGPKRQFGIKTITDDGIR